MSEAFFVVCAYHKETDNFLYYVKKSNTIFSNGSEVWVSGFYSDIATKLTYEEAKKVIEEKTPLIYTRKLYIFPVIDGSIEINMKEICA